MAISYEIHDWFYCRRGFSILDKLNYSMCPQIELHVNVTLVEIHFSLTWKLHSSTSKGKIELPLHSTHCKSCFKFDMGFISSIGQFRSVKQLEMEDLTPTHYVFGVLQFSCVDYEQG